jgi:hypothetical protein
MLLSSGADLETAGPALERACNISREANLTLFRPQSARFLGKADISLALGSGQITCSLQ